MTLVYAGHGDSTLPIALISVFFNAGRVEMWKFVMCCFFCNHIFLYADLVEY